MSTINLKGFIAFVHEQPLDKHVLNTSWASCAIGEYLEAHDVSIRVGSGDISTLTMHTDHATVRAFEADLKQQYTNEEDDYSEQLSLYEYLNSGEFDTYGDIVAALVGEI